MLYETQLIGTTSLDFLDDEKVYTWQGEWDAI